jgi:hypothetical protein
MTTRNRFTSKCLCWLSKPKRAILFTALLVLGGDFPLEAQTFIADLGLETAIRLYGEPVISANPDLLNSTSNDVGPWGSPDFLYSFANDVGPLGSPDMLNSVTNEYGEGLKIRLLDTPLEAPLDLESP